VTGLARLAALLIPASLLAACGSTERVRYKMTVEVETPQGLRTGFAVRESLYRTPPNIPMLGEDRGGVRVKGEAVAVDLPDGQTLFALLSAAKQDFDFAARIPDRFLGYGKGAGPRLSRATLWPSADESRVPLLVRFRDIADPTSIEKVEPHDLSKTFGPGIRLKSISVEICRFCDVTSGIEQRFAWWSEQQGKRFDGTSVNDLVMKSDMSVLKMKPSAFKIGYTA
jgi:hypothetical protein